MVIRHPITRKARLQAAIQHTARGDRFAHPLKKLVGYVMNRPFFSVYRGRGERQPQGRHQDKGVTLRDTLSAVQAPEQGGPVWTPLPSRYSGPL